MLRTALFCIALALLVVIVFNAARAAAFDAVASPTADRVGSVVGHML